MSEQARGNVNSGENEEEDQKQGEGVAEPKEADGMEEEQVE